MYIRYRGSSDVTWKKTTAEHEALGFEAEASIVETKASMSEGGTWRFEGKASSVEEKASNVEVNTSIDGGEASSSKAYVLVPRSNTGPGPLNVRSTAWINFLLINFPAPCQILNVFFLSASRTFCTRAPRHLLIRTVCLPTDGTPP